MDSTKKWEQMVNSSSLAIKDFNGSDTLGFDKSIVWADNQIGCYKEAMLALVRGNSNWAMTVTDDQQKLIETMMRRAEA
jgi:hypothetical protein